MEPSAYSCSMRVVRPFLNVLRRNQGSTLESCKALEGLQADDRVPISTALQILACTETMALDPALGLKASLELEPGDLGAIDYALMSAATLDESLQVAGHYSSLINDSMTYARLVVDGRAVVQIVNLLALPRWLTEFQLGALLVVGKAVWPKELLADLDVWLSGPPANTPTRHERVFSAARVHFHASFSGFSFDEKYLHMALRSSDAKLHEVTCKHLDLMLGRLHQFQTYVGRIRSLLTREFSRGRPTAEQMARLLGTSVSTLARRLETEGTTFSAVFRETQKDLALGYLARPELTVYQVATLSGFAHTAAFHRAFRSWSGMTPLQYRRKRQGLGP